MSRREGEAAGPDGGGEGRAGSPERALVKDKVIFFSCLAGRPVRVYLSDLVKRVDHVEAREKFASLFAVAFVVRATLIGGG